MAATKTASRSRKTGDPRADQAEADRRNAAEQAKITPKPELCPHDLDPATCAECNGSAAAERQAEAQPEAKPEPTGPYAQLAGVEVHIPVYRGVVRVIAADGEVIETIECECRWAHTTPEIAVKCGRKLAVKRGLRIA
jgi:hypothetical protein